MVAAGLKSAARSVTDTKKTLLFFSTSLQSVFAVGGHLGPASRFFLVVVTLIGQLVFRVSG